MRRQLPPPFAAYAGGKTPPAVGSLAAKSTSTPAIDGTPARRANPLTLHVRPAQMGRQPSSQLLNPTVVCVPFPATYSHLALFRKNKKTLYLRSVPWIQCRERLAVGACA